MFVNAAMGPMIGAVAGTATPVVLVMEGGPGGGGCVGGAPRPNLHMASVASLDALLIRMLATVEQLDGNVVAAFEEALGGAAGSVSIGDMMSIPVPDILEAPLQRGAVSRLVRRCAVVSGGAPPDFGTAQGMETEPAQLAGTKRKRSTVTDQSLDAALWRCRRATSGHCSSVTMKRAEGGPSHTKRSQATSCRRSGRFCRSTRRRTPTSPSGVRTAGARRRS